MEEIQRGLQPLLKPGQKLSLEEQVHPAGWRAGQQVVQCKDGA